MPRLLLLSLVPLVIAVAAVVAHRNGLALLSVAGMLAFAVAGDAPGMPGLLDPERPDRPLAQRTSLALCHEMALKALSVPGDADWQLLEKAEQLCLTPAGAGPVAPPS